MLLLYFALVLNTFVFSSSSSVKYCGSKMCGHTNDHTFCQFAPGPSQSCSGYTDARLSVLEKSRIVARLNRRRGDCARGKLPHLPPAANMLKLRWVEELARAAQRWADQCVAPANPEKHDACRDLYSTSVGQCVSSVIGESPGLRIESIIDVWYMQNIYYKENVSVYTSPEKTYYGDFAQMVWAKSYLVGCARSKFMTPWKGRMRSVERLVCNFAPRGPTPNRPLWLQGPPASSCPVRSAPDSELKALCSFQYNSNEKDDVKNTMALEEHALLDAVLKVELNESLQYLGSLDELYLTKLAVNEMIATTTEPLYNYMKRQRNNDVKKETHKDEDDETAGSTRDLNKIFVTKKNTGLIGRPKSYNIEELTDEFSSETQNDLDKTTERKSFIRNDLYEDYEMDNQIEDRDSITSVFGTLDESTDNKNAMTTKKFNETETQKANFGIDFNKTRGNVLNETVTDRIEDYLSDPETLQQLQEALDRMEKAIASTDTTPGKVRRELRGSERHIDTETNSPLVNSINARDVHNNTFAENAPMLKMVLKYMPYLRHYQSTILGTSKASKVFTTLPIFIQFSFYLYSYFLM